MAEGVEDLVVVDELEEEGVGTVVVGLMKVMIMTTMGDGHDDNDDGDDDDSGWEEEGEVHSIMDFDSRTWPHN